MILYYLLLFLSVFYDYVYLPKINDVLTTIKLVGFAAVLAAVFRLPSLRIRLLIFRWGEARLFFMLLFTVIFSTVVVQLQGEHVATVIWSYVSHTAILFVTLVFVDSIERLRRACYVLVLSMAVAALYVFRDFYRWHNPRPAGIVGDSNYYVLVAVCILPMCFRLVAPGVARKVFLYFTGALLVGSVLLASSRGGLLGMTCGLAYMVVRSNRKALHFALVGVVLVASLLVLPQSGWERLTNPSGGDEKSDTMRIELLKAGWAMVKAHPLLGVGLGQFKPASQLYNPNVQKPQIAHNMYLEVAAELGVPALLLFLGILWFSWRRMRKLAAFFRQTHQLESERIAVSIEIGLVGFAISAIFLSAAFIRHLWILIFLGLALQRLAYFQQLSQASNVADGSAPAPVPARPAPIGSARLGIP